MHNDPRLWACAALLTTLATNTALTWPYLPYVPIEFSQMGWGAPGAAGGYYVMAWGMCVTGSVLFRMHIAERSALGAVGAVLMALLGLVNGNDVPTLQTAHGVVAVFCFVVYIAYIYTHNGPMLWLLIASIALLVGHAIIFTQLDYTMLLREGISKWPRVWTEAQAKHPIWILQLKALCQYTMLIALIVSIFSVPHPTIKSA